MLKNPDETKERRRRMRYANDCTDMLTGSSTFQYTMRDMQKKVVSHVLSAIVISLSNITIACVCTAMWSSETLFVGFVLAKATHIFKWVPTTHICLI